MVKKNKMKIFLLLALNERENNLVKQNKVYVYATSNWVKSANYVIKASPFFFFFFKVDHIVMDKYWYWFRWLRRSIGNMHLCVFMLRVFLNFNHNRNILNRVGVVFCVDRTYIDRTFNTKYRH